MDLFCALLTSLLFCHRNNGPVDDPPLVNDYVVADSVLVYKPPGLHPGDIHKFRAVPAPPGFMDFVGSARFGIFFSVQGKRSVVDEMASADLDGDEFWICLNVEVRRPASEALPSVCTNSLLVFGVCSA